MKRIVKASTVEFGGSAVPYGLQEDLTDLMSAAEELMALDSEYLADIQPIFSSVQASVRQATNKIDQMIKQAGG